MEFYHRANELKALQESYNLKGHSSQMVVITGRRRVGKTLLALEYASDKPHLYLFVSKKSETLLCKEYLQEIKHVFGTQIPL